MDTSVARNGKPYQKSKSKMGEGVEELEVDVESKVVVCSDDSPAIPDRWELHGVFLVRVHTEPRSLFIPDEPCPLKVDWLDVHRETRTSLLHDTEAVIRDMWSPSEVQPELSNQWVGEARFQILKPRARDGHEWQQCRECKLQETSRPPSVWPEVWNALSTRQREKKSRIGVRMRPEETQS